MTAINVVRQTKAVHILTDGAGCSADGVLIYETQKVFPIAHLNVVIAGRGSVLFPSNVALLASVQGFSFDQLKESVISKAQAVFADLKTQMNASVPGTEFDLVIAGWSESQGPNSYLICNHSRYKGMAPWTIVELGAISLLPTSEAIAAGLNAAFPNGVHPDEFDPMADGLRVLELQRKHRDKLDPQCGIGAFAQVTTVTPGAITMKIIRRWPDEIGRPLAGQFRACA